MKKISKVKRFVLWKINKMNVQGNKYKLSVSRMKWNQLCSTDIKRIQKEYYEQLLSQQIQ